MELHRKMELYRKLQRKQATTQLTPFCLARHLNDSFFQCNIEIQQRNKNSFIPKKNRSWKRSRIQYARNYYNYNFEAMNWRCWIERSWKVISLRNDKQEMNKTLTKDTDIYAFSILLQGLSWILLLLTLLMKKQEKVLSCLKKF